MENILNILNTFCAYSGEKVSVEKTRLFCSPNINHTIKSHLSLSSSFLLTGDMGKYLGVPLHYTRVNRGTFQFIIDKSRKRMGAWKASTLSLAGRITLVRSVLNSLPIYYMQTSLIPNQVCNELDKIARDFTWGSSRERRKVSLVAWEKLCLPTQCGGLGLKYTRRMNEALLMKLGWELTTCTDKLWVQVLRDKYKCGHNKIPSVRKFQTESNCWRGIRRTWHNVLANIKWNLGDGQFILFWKDVWVGKEPLISLARVNLTDDQLETKVCDFITHDGD